MRASETPRAASEGLIAALPATAGATRRTPRVAPTPPAASARARRPPRSALFEGEGGEVPLPGLPHALVGVVLRESVDHVHVRGATFRRVALNPVEELVGPRVTRDNSRADRRLRGVSRPAHMPRAGRPPTHSTRGSPPTHRTTTLAFAFTFAACDTTPPDRVDVMRCLHCALLRRFNPRGGDARAPGRRGMRARDRVREIPP
jgi:hypothetical protein